MTEKNCGRPHIISPTDRIRAADVPRGRLLAGALRHTAYTGIRAAGPRGITIPELDAQFCPEDRDTLRPAVMWLWKQGCIEKVPE